MVPPQVSADVTKMVLGDEGLLARFAPEPTMSNSVEDPIDESTPWGSTGVLAYWVAEAGQMTASKLATKKLRTELHKLYAFVLASDELLEDAPRLQNRLTVAAADAIKWKAEEAIINGNGAGQPMGVMIAAALVSVSKENAQTAATIVAANALKMRARLCGDGSGAFWLIHSSAIPQLGQMTIGYQPVWGDANKELKSALGATLLGLPIVISEHCQTVGTVGDIQLIQPKGYASYVKSSGMQFAMSMHLYFDYGLNAFRWTFRLGGNPKLSAVIARAKGSETLAHFVNLATRA
jgi:HK97 family phage major capsid protein